MLRKLMRMYCVARDMNLTAFNLNSAIVKINDFQHRVILAVKSSNVPKGLRQYYADLLMLEIISGGETCEQ